MIAIQELPAEQQTMVNMSRTRGQVERLLTRFDPISLAEMENCSLLDRTDTKYVMGISQLCTVLEQVRDQYRVLCINTRRLNHYQTLYFDTNDFLFYQQHHNGRGSRYKVRERKYIGSDLTFFEVKHKTNQNRTVKSRIQIPEVALHISGPADDFVQVYTPFEGEELEPKLWNEYWRLTLVSKRRVERVTLDLNVEFGWDCTYSALPGLAIAEVKQAHFSQESDFIQQMRQLGIRPTSFSKYCAGVYTLYDDLKVNNFKPQIRQIKKVMQKELTHESLH